MDFPEGRLNLYLTEMHEPFDGAIRLVVTEAELGAAENIQIGGADFGEGQPIVISDDSRRFEILWNSYVTYAVCNESYRTAEASEIFVSHFRQHFKSAFLHYVSSTTLADAIHPGKLQHWELITLNHCVDVVSMDAPSIRLIETTGN